MYYVKNPNPDLWTVGCDTPDGWIRESEYNSPGEAYDRARYLNGGHDPNEQPVTQSYTPSRRDYLIFGVMSGMAANPAFAQAKPRSIASLAIDQVDELLDLEASKK
ncbi:MAG: hypothetical protein ACRC62_25980 [Microcoleus sp.]